MKLLSFGEILFDAFPDRAVLGGAPLNLAAHAALQGVDAALWSAVGNDTLGEQALAEAARLGVDVSTVARLATHKTGVCNVTLDANAVPSYRLEEDVAYDHIPSLSPARLGTFDLLAFGTLALRGEDNRMLLEETLAAHEFSDVYCDVNIRAPFYSKESLCLCLSHATILKISDEELPVVRNLLYGDIPLAEKDVLVRLAADFPQLRILLLTCGANGTYALETKTHTWHFCPAAPATPVSTVGAGDSFGATFLASFFVHGDIDRALRRAAIVSAFVVSRQGAVPEDLQEFLARLP